MTAGLTAEWVDAPVVAVWLTPSGTIRHASPSMVDLTGPDRPSLIGTRLGDRLRPDLRAAFGAWLGTHWSAAGARTGSGRPIELAGIRADGLPWRVAVAPVGPVEPDGSVVLAGRALGGPVRWAASSGGDAGGDAAAAAGRGDEAGAASLDVSPASGPGVDGVVSHDLRASLRHASGFGGVALRTLAEAVDSGRVDDDLGTARARLEMAVAALSTADLIAERVVHCLRISSVALAMADLDLDQVVGRADQISRTDHAAPGSPLAGPGLGRCVGSFEHLAGALAEVLTNSRRFGGADVAISVTAEHRSGWIELVITDDGPGVDPTLAEDAFHAGRMLQPRGSHPGVGFGLTVCRLAVARHAGRCWLGGRADGAAGAEVRLVLPAATSSSSQ